MKRFSAAAAAFAAAAWQPAWGAAENVERTFGGMHGAVFILVDAALVAVLIAVAFKRVRRSRTPENELSADRPSYTADEAEAPPVTDPVCGRRFKKRDALDYVVSKGRTVFFCSPECKRKFEKAPALYENKLMVEI